MYQAGVSLRNTGYDRGWLKPVQLPCRVVSIGNLTVGGTGKTACVELITKKLIAMGKHVAVLSRGYGGARRDYWLRWDGGRLSIDGQPVVDAEGLPPHQNIWCGGLADEPQLLARHLAGVPVVVGSRRDRTGAFACRSFGCDAVILDDGFQHRRVHRDCEIVLVHVRMPFGGWAVLPRGPMREGLSSLKRAHVLLVTKADEAFERLGALTERLRSLNPHASLVTAVHEPRELLDCVTGARHEPQRLNGLRVGLVSSIGDPAGFETTVRRLHAAILWHHAFPDHYRYRPVDWDMILGQISASRPDAVITTEKDWVRLQPCTAHCAASAVPLWVLSVQMKILDGETALDDRLARL